MKSLINHHFYTRKKEKGLDEVYIAISLRVFALSLIMVFIPIYFYNIGYSLRDILTYYFFISFFFIIGDYVTGKLIARFGSKHVLVMSFPLLIIYFFLLFTLEIYHWPLFLLALSYAIPGNLFWVSYHNDFSKAKHKKNIGKELGVMQILVTLSGALGPLIGGIIAQQFGIQYTIIFTVIFLMIGVIPLLRAPKIASRKTFDIKSFSVKRNFKDMVAYGGYGLEETASLIVWPLFIFLIVGTYKQVGFITSMALMVAIFITIFVGKLTDKYEKRKVLQLGGVLHFSSGITKAVVTSAGAAYFVSTFASITQVFLHIPFISEYYLHADGKPRTEYIVGMEMSVDFVRTLGLLLLIIATYFFDLKGVLIIAIFIGSLGALLATLIGNNDRKKDRTIKVQKEIAKVRA